MIETREQMIDRMLQQAQVDTSDCKSGTAIAVRFAEVIREIGGIYDTRDMD